MTLESFTMGRDSGIDFRYRSGGVHLIVQGKHYAESGCDALARVLAGKEHRKLDALKPTRYILATSVGLTPARKEELLKILAPYCLEPADILGREDINNLLTQHGDVERKHFKLWLTSTAVLERVLKEGICSDSDRHLERIHQRLCRCVPKLYVAEPGSDVVRAQVDRATVVSTSLMAYAEARAALARRRRERVLAPAAFDAAKRTLEADWPKYLAVQVTEALCKDAGQLAERYARRGYDSVHLASFLEVARQAGAADTEFSSSDDRLNTAAARAVRALGRG